MAKKSRNSVNKKAYSTKMNFPVILGTLLLLSGVLLWLAFFTTKAESFGVLKNAPTMISFVHQMLLTFFGHVSILVFGVGLLMLSAYSYKKFENKLLLRLGMGFVLLSTVFSYFMSLRVYTSEGCKNDAECLINNGGILGNALSEELKKGNFPFENSVFIPVFLGVIALFLVLGLCFEIRAKHFKFIVIISKVLWKIPEGIFKLLKERRRVRLEANIKKEFVAIEAPEVSRKKSQKAIVLANVADFDDTVIELPKMAKPFKVGGVWGSTLGTLPPLKEGLEDISTVISNEEATHEDRLEMLERKLRENGAYLGDVEKRKMRDEVAELRRIRQINRWEDANEILPNVEGILREKALNSKDNQEEKLEEVKTKEKTKIGNDELAYVTVGGNVTTEEILKEDDSFSEILNVDVEKETLDLEESKNLPAQSNEILDESVTTLATAPIYDPYVIPKAESVLEKAPLQSPEYTEDELQILARELELHLESYKVKGKVTNIVTGPVITRFEVEPGPGIKVSKFQSLQDDLALALKAISIRILAPIPGKSVVGIEIPNRRFQTIFCSDLFCAEHFSPSTEKLQIVLGKDITGAPFTMDLARAPHLLIAGQTGSGKSVCINVLMASLLLSKTPDELRLVLVDPKVVELKMYENIPHLLTSVITQPERAVEALRWLCNKMDERYELLARMKVRNLFGFNEKIKAGLIPDDFTDEERKQMPFIVVVIDELADLMMVAGKEVEKSIARIAQKARAVGIHLVLATQRPSANVITGLIKANLPTRISFKVGSALDSRIILDMQGAEKLLGRGDMLYKLNDDPVRVHGAFLSDKEAECLANACSNQNVYYKRVTNFDCSNENDEDALDGAHENGIKKLDPLLFEVAAYAINMHGVSVSGVQRSFSVGFSRAGKIVDQLEQIGVCGKSKGNSKPRDILIDEAALENLKAKYF